MRPKPEIAEPDSRLPLLVWPACAVAAGIGLVGYGLVNWWPLVLVAPILAGAWAWRCLGRERVLVAFLLAFFVLGAGRQAWILNSPDLLSSWENQSVQATVTVLERVPAGESAWSVPAEVLCIAQGQEDMRLAERALFRGYLPLDRPLLPGETVRGEARVVALEDPANFGAYDYRAQMRRQGIRNSLRLVESHGAPERVRDTDAVRAAIHGFRTSMENEMRATLAEDQFGLLSGLLLGERAWHEPETERALRQSGVSHLLAVSGLHVGFLAGAVLYAGRRLGLPPRRVAWGGMLAVLFYALLVGARASVARAGLMASAGFAGLVAGRRTDAWAALAGAALVLLLWRPWLLFTAGFQLSFFATAGILLLAPEVAKCLDLLPSWLRLPLAVSLSAQLATWPLVAYHFGGIPLLAPLANLAAVPLAAILVAGGLIAGAVAVILPGPGAWFFLPLGGLLEVFAWGISALASVPGAYQHLTPPPAGTIVAYYLLLSVACLKSKHRERERSVRPAFAGRLALTVGITAVLLLFPAPHPSSGVEITFLSVGMGDAAFVNTPEGNAFLVDAGPGPLDSGYDAGEKVVAPFLRRNGVSRLDGVIISHPHYDHYGGLESVHREIEIEALVLPPEFPACDFGPVPASGVPVYRAQAGDVLWLGRETTLEFVHPSPPLMEGTRCDANNNSLVAVLRKGQVAVLFTGDLEEEGEALLLEQGQVPPAQVLKVGHHGSGTSTGEEFLQRVNPEVAVIPVGANPWGHPREEVLERLRKQDVQVLRTDVDGAVRIRIHGDELTVETARPRRNEPAA